MGEIYYFQVSQFVVYNITHSSLYLNDVGKILDKIGCELVLGSIVETETNEAERIRDKFDELLSSYPETLVVDLSFGRKCYKLSGKRSPSSNPSSNSSRNPSTNS